MANPNGRQTELDVIAGAMKGNVVDQIVEVFSPIRAIRRKQARVHSALLGGYIGGQRDRRQTQGWLPSQADADTSLRDRTALVDRSQDLERNNPIARGAINTVTTSVVGTGLKLNSTIDRKFLGMSEEAADEWEDNTQREFALFANSPECDLERRVNFAGQQELAFRATLVSGDILVTLPWVERKGSVYALKTQLVEGARVTNPNGAADTVTMIGGVEKDKYGAAVAFHVSQFHPGSMLARGNEWDRIPAYTRSGRRNAILLARYIRPGQTRGEPYLAPVIEALKQLGRYSEAEMMAAVISSFFTVAIKSPQGNIMNPWRDEPQDNSEDFKLGSGAVVGLAPGEEVDTINPGRPNAQYEPFVTAQLREIGVALELPFEILIKHFTSSYSASMAALLEAWRFFLARRSWIASNLCQIVYETWLEESVARGRTIAPGFLDGDPLIRQAYSGSSWTGPSKGQIREDVETKGAVSRLDAGLSSLSREVPALTGENWETVHEQRAKETRARVNDGLQVDPSAEADPNPNDPDLDI